MNQNNAEDGVALSYSNMVNKDLGEYFPSNGNIYGENMRSNGQYMISDIQVKIGSAHVTSALFSLVRSVLLEKSLKQ